MGLRVQSTVVCFPVFFSFFRSAGACGLRKQFINNIVFPTFACAGSFNNHNINNNCGGTSEELAFQSSSTLTIGLETYRITALALLQLSYSYRAK